MSRLIFLLQLLLLAWVQKVSSSNHTYSTSALPPFDCKNVKANGFIFDLSGLPSPVTISSNEDTPPTTTRTEIRISLCESLEKEPVPAPEQCASGTRVCMKVYNIKNGDERLTQAIAAGGSESGEWPWSAELGGRLEGAERSLELELHGSQYNRRTQRTEIDFQCDHQAAKDSKPDFKKYDREDGKLKLVWITPHACAKNMPGAGDGQDDTEKGGTGSGSGSAPSGSSSGWGFFSWFFFFIFVGGLAYFAIGFWRNYNEYGVIELPNKDFWREAPYIAKDMGKHIYSTVSGQGSSRGAYEPV